MNETKRYKGCYITYKSSHNGMAIFEIALYRTTRSKTHESFHTELELERSSIRCVVNAMKAFAEAERKAVGELPL